MFRASPTLDERLLLEEMLRLENINQALIERVEALDEHVQYLHASVQMLQNRQAAVGLGG